MSRTCEPQKPGKVVRVRMKPEEHPKVVLQGDIDFRRASEIVDAVSGLLLGGHERIDIALERVEFMDSSGISALLDSVRLAGEKGARLVLVSPTRQLVHLLEVSGFKPLFEIEYPPVKPSPAYPGTVRPGAAWQFSEFSVPCDPEYVSDIRRRVTQLTNSMPFTGEEVEDIKLAVGEASTNAFRYGCPRGCADTISVRCIGDSRGLTVEIIDSGKGFDPDRVPVPELGNLEPGGRGIFFMRLTMDKVEFERLDTGTLVRLVKYIKTPAPTVQ